jgi:hypothetical protein
MFDGIFYYYSSSNRILCMIDFRQLSLMKCISDVNFWNRDVFSSSVCCVRPLAFHKTSCRNLTISYFSKHGCARLHIADLLMRLVYVWLLLCICGSVRLFVWLFEHMLFLVQCIRFV